MLTVINFRILFFFSFFFKPAAYVWGHIIEIINQEPQHWVTTFTSFANATVCGLPKCSLIYILTTRLSSIFLPWEPAQTQQHWLFSFFFFFTFFTSHRSSLIVLLFTISFLPVFHHSSLPEYNISPVRQTNIWRKKKTKQKYPVPEPPTDTHLPQLHKEEK